MQIKKCDRCGDEIIEYPLQQAMLPRYSIVAVYNAFNVVNVDLCIKCQNDFTKWLHGESEDKVELKAHVTRDNGEEFDIPQFENTKVDKDSWDPRLLINLSHHKEEEK